MLHLPTPVPSPAPPPISTSNQAALSQLAHVASLHQQHPHPRSSVQKAPSSSQQTRGGLYLPTTTSTPKHATSTSPSVTRALPNVTNASPNTGLHHQTPNFPLSIQTGFTSQASSAILQNTIPQRNYQTNNSDLYKQCQPQPPSAKSNPCKRKRIIACRKSCFSCHFTQ